MSRQWKTKQVTREDFTREEISTALVDNTGNLTAAARSLTKLGKGRVSRQLLRYWCGSEDLSVTKEEDVHDHLVQRHRAQDTSRKLRRDNKALMDALTTRQDFFDSVEKTVDALRGGRSVVHDLLAVPITGKPMTVELLLSDLQIGKLSPVYNTPIAQNRLFEYGRAAVMAIKQKVDLGYNVERIVLGILGDIVESDKKHINSGRACDTGTAEQMHDAMVGIYELVIEPLAQLGIPMEVICVTGNHDHDGHGLNMYMPGKEHLSYPLYKSLEYITRVTFPDVVFNIPNGAFAIGEIYGNRILYEHGVGVSVTEAAMKARKTQRTEQLGDFLTYFRMG